MVKVSSFIVALLVVPIALILLKLFLVDTRVYGQKPSNVSAVHSPKCLKDTTVHGQKPSNVSAVHSAKCLKGCGEFQSKPMRFLGKTSQHYVIGMVEDGDRKLGYIVINGNDTFHIVSPGLTDNCGTVSLESVGFPKFYLQHNGFLFLDFVTSEEACKSPKDATFYWRPNHFYPGYISFESVASPGLFIRNHTERLQLSEISLAQHKIDASFKVPEDSIADEVSDRVQFTFPESAEGLVHSLEKCDQHGRAAWISCVSSHWNYTNLKRIPCINGTEINTTMPECVEGSTVNLPGESTSSYFSTSVVTNNIDEMNTTTTEFVETTTMIPPVELSSTSTNFSTSVVTMENGTPDLTESITGTPSNKSLLSSRYTAKNIIEMLDSSRKSNKVNETRMKQLIGQSNHLQQLAQNFTNSKEDFLSREDKLRFVESMEVLSSNLALKGNNVTVRRSSMLFKATKIEENKTEEMKYNLSLPSADGTYSALVKIPPLTGNMMGRAAITFLYEDSALFPSPLIQNTKASQVFSFKISDFPLNNLKRPITYTLTQPASAAKDRKVLRLKRCAYFNISKNDWMFDGCKSVEGTDPLRCECNHATNFAVLVQTRVLLSDYPLEMAGKIGCSLSVIGLLLMIIPYLCIKQLRTNQINQIHLNLAFCLLVGYITFLIGVERPRAYVPCMAVGAILQCSFLAAWGWMFAELVTMYRKFVKVFSHIGSRYVIKLARLVYPLSAVVTLLTLTLAVTLGDNRMYTDWVISKEMVRPSSYVSDRLCWLHGYCLYFGFFVPVGLILVANCVGFILIIRKITASRPEIVANQVIQVCLKKQARRVVTVSLLLGVTWAFAIPMTFIDDVTTNKIFSWLFCIANSLQGCYIFYVFCLQSHDVRGLLWIRLQRNALTRYYRHRLDKLVTKSTENSPTAVTYGTRTDERTLESYL